MFEPELSFRHHAVNSADRSQHFFIAPEKFLNESAHCSLVSTTSIARRNECAIGMRIAYRLHHEATITFVSQHRKDMAMTTQLPNTGYVRKRRYRRLIRTRASRRFGKKGGCEDGCLVPNRTANTADRKTKAGAELCRKASASCAQPKRRT